MFVYSLFLLQYHLFVSFYLLFKDFLLLKLNLGHLVNYRMTLHHPNRHAWKYSSHWNLYFPALGIATFLASERENSRSLNACFPFPCLLCLSISHGPRGGFFHQFTKNCTWMCLPDLENLTSLSLYQFFAKFPTHEYTIFESKAPNLDQIGCFIQQFCPKYTQFM